MFGRKSGLEQVGSDPDARPARRPSSWLWRIGVFALGVTVFGLGVLAAPLPGPGPIVLCPVGLSILATEFMWARRALKEFDARTAAARTFVARLAVRSPLWAPALAIMIWAGVQVLGHWAIEAWTDADHPIWRAVLTGIGTAGLIPIAYWGWLTFRVWRARRAGRGGRGRRARATVLPPIGLRRVGE